MFFCFVTLHTLDFLISQFSLKTKKAAIFSINFLEKNYLLFLFIRGYMNCLPFLK